MPRRYVAREEREPTLTGRERPAGRSRITVPGNRGVKVVRAVTIRRPAHDLYEFWRNVENLPRIVRHPVVVVARSRDESRWSVRGPGGTDYQWVSLIINDEPDRLIAWRTRVGAAVAHAGTVRFEPTNGGGETEVTVQLEYDPPGGKLGQWLAKLTGTEPGQQVGEALNEFKLLMEHGEFPTENPPGSLGRGNQGRAGPEEPAL